MATTAATQTVVLERQDRFGRTAIRLAAAAIGAVLVLSALAGAADARTVSTTLGQNDFVQACRNGGGTPKRVSTHVVQCTTSDGTVVTCDFNSSPASCTIPFTRPQGSIVAPIDGGVLAQDFESQPSGPRTDVTVTGSVGTGAVFTQAEPTPEPTQPASGQVIVAVDASTVDTAAAADSQPAPDSGAAQDADAGTEQATTVVDAPVLVHVDEEQP